MMLLGNFLLVKASLNSYELAKSKVRTRTIMQGDVEASIVNVILRSEDDSDTVTTTTTHEDRPFETRTSVDQKDDTDAIQTNNMRQIEATSTATPASTDSAAAFVSSNGPSSTDQATIVRVGDSKNMPVVEDGDVSIAPLEGEPADPLVETQEDTVAPSPTTASVSNNAGTPALSAVLSEQQLRDEKCFASLGYGLVEALRSSSRSFCTDGSSSSPYSFYHVPDAEFSATQLNHLVLDMRGAQVAGDIASVAQDGGGHDPRFKYTPLSVFCSCDGAQDASHGAPNLWLNLLAGAPTTDYFVCESSPEMANTSLVLDRAVVLARKDDHNPFFQISGILNAWIMMKVLGWDSSSTQLVTLDRALPSPIDELRHVMLGPDRPIVGGDELQQHVVRFESALLAPYEARGPIMSHLNDDQPCHSNKMVKDFRDDALRSMNVVPHKTDPKRCLVTVISRRPYSGRRIQRMWRNEDEILNLMRSDYKDAYRFGECEFQSLDFVNMTMRDQMQTMVDSDVVIGMHGAGMVNAMWTRPGALVVEIFPRFRFRWGYRNLCQYLGCSWHEFREGADLFVRTTDPNDMDKRLRYDEWKRFFDPLFRDVITMIEMKIEAT